MNKKLSTILTVLLILMLTTSTVGAAGAIKLSGGFTSSSIHFDGYATGVGGYTDGITLEIIGIGIPVVACTNPAGNQAPGQNPSKVTATGAAYISPDQIDFTTKKGKTPVSVSADETEWVLTGTQGGCPNDNWTATVTGILWTGAVINVYNGEGTDGLLVKTFVYSCDPTKQVGNVLSCTQISP